MSKETSNKDKPVLEAQFDDTTPEVQTPAEVQQSAPEETQRVLLSNTDAYVHDRMKSQPAKIEDIRVDRTEARDPSKHRLSLPDELKEYGKKYAFRWLMKNKQALDYACDVRGWIIVSRSYFPELPKHLFTVNSSIERGDAILAFIPIEIAEQIRKEPGEASSNIIQGMFEKHENDPRYYTPESGTKEDKYVQKI